MKILVISLAGIGDTLFATPLIHELRLNFPHATIDALVLWNGSRDLLQGNPHLNTVFQKNLIKDPALGNLQFLLQLRNRRYDFSLNTHPQSRIQYRGVAKLINARRRVSHSYDHPPFLDRFLATDFVPQDYYLHCVENNLNLLRVLDGKSRLSNHEYELFLDADDAGWARHYLGANDLVGKILLGFHVGSGTTKNLALRRWPLEHFASLIQKINSAFPDVRMLLLGGPEETKDHQWLLKQAPPGSVLAPETQNLRQAAALLQASRVFVSVDTALMHVAAAAKVPHHICIETPSFNQTVEPYGRPFVMIKNPMLNGRHLDFYRYDGQGIKAGPEEMKQLMASVTVEAVFGAVSAAVQN